MRRTILMMGFLLFITLPIYAKSKKITKEDTLSIEKVINIEIKEGENPPDFYINGKKIDSDIVKLLDKSKINYIEIIKGEDAQEKYNASGVVLISTKPYHGTTVKSDSSFIITGEKEVSKMPTIIIDSRIRDKDELKNLEPGDIKLITIQKDEESKRKYKSEYGVIKVTTIKAKKDK